MLCFVWKLNCGIGFAVIEKIVYCIANNFTFLNVVIMHTPIYSGCLFCFKRF